MTAYISLRKVHNKVRVFFQELNWFEITGCQPDCYAILKKAKHASDDVAELCASSIKGKAARIRKLQKEEAV